MCLVCVVFVPLFCVLYVCGTSESFPVIFLCRNFLSVFDLLIFDLSSSVLNFQKSQSFSNAIYFSEWSSGVSVSGCFGQFFLLLGECYLVYSLINSSILFLSFSIRYSDRVCGVLLGVAMPKEYFVVFSFLSQSFTNRSFFEYWSKIDLILSTGVLPEWFQPLSVVFFFLLFPFHQNTVSVPCLRSCFLV